MNCRVYALTAPWSARNQPIDVADYTAYKLYLSYTVCMLYMTDTNYELYAIIESR